MAVHEFGGAWTTEKLERLRKYLVAYTTIFSKNPKAQNLITIYVDAFAGTGYRNKPTKTDPDAPLFPELTEPETVDFLKGSARIALEVDPPFNQYLFIEQDTEHTRELEKLKVQFPNKAGAVKIIQGEANTYLKKWCSETNWQKHRAVMFLDPYGMQVEWPLIEAIATTRAIDLWLLVPFGMGVNRMLTNNVLPPVEWSEKLTRIFGTDLWEKEFYSTHKKQTLFDNDEVQVKNADFRKIEQFFVGRLNTIFAEVAKNPLWLMNSKNSPLYLLCFAAGNPRGAPTAVKIAQDILGK